MKPLTGLRILTFEQFGAGPYGTLFLAELGAEVIKIENGATGGDPSRKVGPYMLGEDSEYFQSWSLSKKSVTLDIKQAEDRAAFEKLVVTADAVVNNMRGEQPEKLRIDYENLKAVNPKIVCLHISGYGRDNSRRSWPGYDYLMQAEAGLMELAGEPDGPPCRAGPSMIDYMSGITGVVGLLSAVIKARETGTGCDVDVSLFDVALHQLGYTAVWYLNEGAVSRRQPRGAHLSLTPVQTFPTADGWLYIMCMAEKFFPLLAEALGRGELAQDDRYRDHAARLKNRDALTEILDAIFRAETTETWLERLSGIVPVSPIHPVDTALDSDFVAETGMVQAVPHPDRADYRALANPIKIDGKRLSQKPAPALGADNDELLG
jgi:crotonobetainyl-CoA:carnitine CoA-transferase CaiB-like acyl-CoA transferase